MLQEQLQERARERIRVEEQQECERLMMLKEMERLRQEELRQQVEKKIRAQQLVAEVCCLQRSVFRYYFSRNSGARQTRPES